MFQGRVCKGGGISYTLQWGSKLYYRGSYFNLSSVVLCIYILPWFFYSVMDAFIVCFLWVGYDWTMWAFERVSSKWWLHRFIGCKCSRRTNCMHVLNISSPSTTVSMWNVYSPSFIWPLVEVARKFVHNNSTVLMFHPKNPLVWKTMVTNAKQLGSMVYKD